jgi:hypothetical protein
MIEEIYVLSLEGVHPSCFIFVHVVNEKCHHNIMLLHDKRTEKET